MEKVNEQIETLVKLQKIDAEIYGLKEEKADMPARKQALEEEFAQKAQGLKAREDNLRSLQLKRKESEVELESRENEVKKYQSQLLQVKTNREYMSLQKEIEGLKADNAVLEDEILELMEKIDQVKAEVAREREALVAAEKKLKEEMAKIDERIRQIDAGISSRQQERAELCPQLEGGLLAQYERILKAKGELALVPIVGESCGGCHRVLPAQVISEARMRDKIITCEFCSRLLYWPI